jgi:hypothetical protein
VFTLSFYLRISQANAKVAACLVLRTHREPRNERRMRAKQGRARVHHAGNSNCGNGSGGGNRHHSLQNAKSMMLLPYQCMPLTVWAHDSVESHTLAPAFQRG